MLGIFFKSAPGFFDKKSASARWRTADFLSKNPLRVGETYFPGRRTSKYHRFWTVSLLCSEWEEVLPVQVNHQRAKGLFLLRMRNGYSNRSSEIMITDPFRTKAFGWPINRVRDISIARLNTLLCVHLRPINVVVFHDR